MMIVNVDTEAGRCRRDTNQVQSDIRRRADSRSLTTLAETLQCDISLSYPITQSVQITAATTAAGPQTRCASVPRWSLRLWDLVGPQTWCACVPRWTCRSEKTSSMCWRRRHVQTEWRHCPGQYYELLSKVICVSWWSNGSRELDLCLRRCGLRIHRFVVMFWVKKL